MPGITSQLVVDAAGAAGAQVLYEPDKTKLRERLLAVTRAGDVVITLGAGDITRVGRELVQWLRAA